MNGPLLSLVVGSSCRLQALYVHAHDSNQLTVPINRVWEGSGTVQQMCIAGRVQNKGMFIHGRLSPMQTQASVPSWCAPSYVLLSDVSGPALCVAGGPPGAGACNLHDPQWPHFHGRRHHEECWPPLRGAAPGHHCLIWRIPSEGNIQVEPEGTSTCSQDQLICFEWGTELICRSSLSLSQWGCG